MMNLSCFRYLPREVDPLVYNMSHEDPGNITYSMIGGLSEQIRELREVRYSMYFIVAIEEACSFFSLIQCTFLYFIEDSKTIDSCGRNKMTQPCSHRNKMSACRRIFYSESS